MGKNGSFKPFSFGKPKAAREESRRLNVRRQNYKGRFEKYGVTREWFERQTMAQGGRCVICQQSRPLAIDHDHTSGRVRALLCRQCNSAIRLLEENPERMQRAAVYVKRWAENNSR